MALRRHSGQLALGLALLVAGACGKSAAPPAEDAAAKKIAEGAQQVQQGAQQVAQNSQQMAQGLQQMAEGMKLMAKGTGDAVDYETLKALLPEFPGWARSDERGEQLSMPVTYARAQARYRKDDGRMDLEITDTAQSQILLAPMSMFLASGFSERSDDGFKRSAKLAGHPAIEDWSAKTRHGEVTVVVNNRFVAHAIGRDVDSLDPVRRLVESVDLPALASMK